MAGNSWSDLARIAAEAFGVTVLVGVRPKGTWFAHADGVEYDGGSPLDAVRAVALGLERRAEKARSTAMAEVRQADAALDAFREGTA